jgi:hypothetical protein
MSILPWTASTGQRNSTLEKMSRPVPIPLLLLSAFANHGFSLGRFLPNHFLRIQEPDARNGRVRICGGRLWRNPVRYQAN